MNKKILIYKDYLSFYQDKYVVPLDQFFTDIILIKDEPTSGLYTIAKGLKNFDKGILNEYDVVELLLNNE
jgi:hypothetical protein